MHRVLVEYTKIVLQIINLIFKSASLGKGEK